MKGVENGHLWLFTNLELHITFSLNHCPANLLVVFLHVSLPNDRKCWTQTIFSSHWVSGFAPSGREDIARKKTFSARHWQQIEKGRPITMKTLLRITIALDVPLPQLVRGLPRPSILER
jgi:hypothetical protein